MLQLLVLIETPALTGTEWLWRPYAARGEPLGRFPDLRAVTRQVKRLATTGVIREAVALRGTAVAAHWKVDLKTRTPRRI